VALRGRTPLLVAGIALGAFIIGYGVTALAFGTARGPTDVALVPDVRELTVEAASRALDDEGLSIEVGDSLPNANAPEGAVLAQSPLPGEEVSPGTAVRVIVSTGQPKLTVPEVEAMPVALATRALEAAGFTVTVEELPGQGQPGRVLDADPASGSPVPLPATVHLRVGGAPPRMEVPSVIGMLEGQARDLLEREGLRVTEVQYERTTLGEPGGVVGQDPAPGDSVAAGSPVRLRVTEPQRSGGEERGVTRLRPGARGREEG
jgi:eukaryotic-like serine/threonine-protein kinase